MTDAWHERLKHIGEARGEPPPLTRVKKPRPQRQKTLQSLLTKPENFDYFEDWIGWVRYKLVADEDDFVCFLATVEDPKSMKVVGKWTTLIWVFKKRCELHDSLLQQYKLSTPERVIHTNRMLTSDYVRKRGNLDWILNGIKQNFGYVPYSAL